MFIEKSKVQLLSYTSDPEKVITAAAKLCYSNSTPSELFEKQTDESIEKFIKMIMGLGHCYDEETEVLTSEGFKLFSSITESDKLACFNPEDATLKGFEYPEKIHKRYVNENLIKFTHKKCDLLVTEGHRLYCSISNSKEKRINPVFEVLHANDTLNTGKQVWESPIRMKSCGYNKNYEEKEFDAIYSLFGFFIGDGYVRKDIKTESSNILNFRLKRDRKVKYLKDICNKINLEVIELACDKYNVILPDEIKAIEFRKMFYNSNGEKTIPLDMMEMSNAQFEYFLEGLINSDGDYTNKESNTTYFTTSKELKDRLQALCSINGRPVTVKKNKKNVYVLNICRERSSSPMFNDSRGTSKVEKVKYEGNVYCATVSTGLLMIRRRGLTTLSGNCSILEHASFTFAIEDISRVTEVQLVRHRTGSPSIQSGRYVKRNPHFFIPEAIKNDKIASEMYIYNCERATQTYLDLIDRLERILVAEKLNISTQETYTLECMTERAGKLSVYEKERRKIEKIALEDARYALPQSLRTHAVFSIDLRNLIHLISKRKCKRAQKEIRMVASQMYEQIKPLLPNIIKYIGAPCEIGSCPEGSMCCGEPYDKKR